MSGGPQPKTHYLTSALVEAGVLDEQQIERALARQRETGRRIGETLVEMGIASEEDIAWALARQLDLTFVDVRIEAIRPDGTRVSVRALAAHAGHAARAGGSRAAVAFSDPTDSAAIAELEVSSCHVTAAVAATSQIAVALDAVFGGSARSAMPQFRVI